MFTDRGRKTKIFIHFYNEENLTLIQKQELHDFIHTRHSKSNKNLNITEGRLP